MPPIIARTLRAAVRPSRGSIRETPAGVEFYHSRRLRDGLGEAVAVLVGVWDGATWRPVAGEPAACPSAGDAVALFEAAAAAGVAPRRPLSPAEVRKELRASGQTGVATGRITPRNRAYRPVKREEGWDRDG